MWVRAEVKKRAWEGLKDYYWKAVLCTFLLGLLGSLSFIPYFLAGLIISVCWCIAPVAPFMSCIVDGFYANILGIGGIKFYMQSMRDRSAAPLSTMFSGFKTGHYTTSAKISTFRNIFLSLWYMLLVVPGIMKSYEYRMIPYLIADYPEKDQDEIFRLSKQMMTGNKWKVFVFDLTFTGWFLLAMLPLFLGLPFIMPYYNAACIELYKELKKECLGISDEYGHGSHEVYQPEIPVPLISERSGTGNDQYADYTSVDDDAPTMDIYNSYVGTPASPYGTPMLTGIQGEYAGASIPLEAGQKLIVGRDASRCNVILSSHQVSRLHMTVEFVENRFIVVDYSTYGTFDLEQGQLPKEKSVSVAPGSSLRLGHGEDVFRLELK